MRMVIRVESPGIRRKVTSVPKHAFSAPVVHAMRRKSRWQPSVRLAVARANTAGRKLVLITILKFRHLAGAVATLARGIEANKLIIAVSRFSSPSVDAMFWKPPSVNDDETDGDGGEKHVCPDATGERRRPYHQRHTEERLKETTPARSVFFEASEVEMPEHQTTRGDGHVEPIGVSSPHTTNMCTNRAIQ